MINRSFTTKNWNTNIQAFGATEKRFASVSKSQTAAENPGPGNYNSERHQRLGPKGFVLQRVRGQMVKLQKSNNCSASFKSSTGRQMEKEISHAIKLNYPGS